MRSLRAAESLKTARNQPPSLVTSGQIGFEIHVSFGRRR